MIYILIPALVIMMAMVLISLFKGLNAFRQGIDAGVEPGTGATELQLRQNKMMWARIKYQGIAIVIVMILLAASR